MVAYKSDWTVLHKLSPSSSISSKNDLISSFEVDDGDDVHPLAGTVDVEAEVVQRPAEARAVQPLSCRRPCVDVELVRRRPRRRRFQHFAQHLNSGLPSTRAIKLRPFLSRKKTSSVLLLSLANDTIEIHSLTTCISNKRLDVCCNSWPTLFLIATRK